MPVQATANSKSGPNPVGLEVIDLERLAYAPAFQRQMEVHAEVLAGQRGPTVLLVEHDPVITVSRRKGATTHVVAAPAMLARLGIDVQPTDRGGDVTYHGPGQLVAYPILRLNDYGMNVGAYMRFLEEAVIATLAGYGVTGFRDAINTGVWVRVHPAQPPAKICAMGVRVKRNVTLHGLALNVAPDMSHFQTIIPCGLVGRGVTSLRQLLGDTTPTIARVKTDLVTHLRRLLEARRGAQAFETNEPRM